MAIDYTNYIWSDGTGTPYPKWEWIPTPTPEKNYWYIQWTETKPEKSMTKMSSIMKRILDADTRKLVEAGLLTKDLELTSEGKEALVSLMFEQNKADLVKIAEDILSEEKK